MPDPLFDLSGVLQALVPKLRKRRYIACFCAIASVLLGASATFALLTTQQEIDHELVILTALIGLIGALVADGWVNNFAQRMIIPHLAETLGLNYERKAQQFLNALPSRLLPKGSMKYAEDWISGDIGSRRMDLAEVCIYANRGKTPKKLFRGFVVRFETVAMLPAFFIAPKRKTETWFNKIIVSDLIEIEERTGQNGNIYGVWMTEKGVAEQHPALTPVLDILLNLETELGVDTTLFSATSTGEELHIALAHKKNLFRIGGLLIGEQKITNCIERALRELQVPFQIASKLLEAEQQSDHALRQPHNSQS